MNNNIRANIMLKSSNSGGRKSPISAPYFAFRLQIGLSFYDARGYLSENDIFAPGDEKVVMVKFLDPDTVMPKLKIGDILSIWERQNVGQLEVLEIFNPVNK